MIVIPGLFSRQPKNAKINFVTLATGRGLTVLGGWQSDLGVTLNAGNVSSLADQSGHGNPLANASAPNQPPYVASDAGINGNPKLAFDGSASALLASALDLPAPPITVYTVFKHRAWTAGHELWSAGSGSSYVLSPNTSTPQLLTFNGTLGPLNGGATLGSWVRSIQKFTNSTSDSLKLGSTVVTGTNCGNTNPAANWWLGRNSGGTTFAPIDWAMQLIIGSATSGADDSALDAAVTSMYGAGVLV